MNIKPITPEISVSPQISVADIKTLKDKGYRSIICNRPDGEEVGQIEYKTIEKAAKDEGLEFRYIPVVSGSLRDEDAAAFAQALKEVPGPVFAYCRSGTRSAMLWSLSQVAENKPFEEILAATKAAGYDMSGLAQRVSQK